jgi:hypothetical protein
LPLQVVDLLFGLDDLFLGLDDLFVLLGNPLFGIRDLALSFSQLLA